MKKVSMFIALLAAFTAVAMMLYSLFCTVAVDSDPAIAPWKLRQAVLALYTLSPLLAVLVVERFQLGRLIREYRLTIKGVAWSKVAIYLLATIILVPLVVWLVVCLTGSCGRACGNFCAGGCPMVVEMFPAIGKALLWALTIEALNALIGEFAWRGFLTKELSAKPCVKSLTIGVIWWAWQVPAILVLRYAFAPTGCEWGVVLLGALLLSLVCSLLYNDALRTTRTLWSTALLQGVIASSFWGWVIAGTAIHLPVWSWLLTALAVLVVLLVTRQLIKEK